MRLHTTRPVAPFHPTLKRNSMTKSILVTGSSSGFGEMTAYALANAGHQVFASMRDIQGRNQDKTERTRTFANEKGRDIRPLELDVLDNDSVKRAIQSLMEAAGKIDVIVHNAGKPADQVVMRDYAEGPTRTLEAEVAQGHEAVQPAGSDPLEVARAIVEVVGLPAGKRPLHVTVDPADMGYELVAAMRDRIRAYVYRRMGLDNLLNR
jgi:hypothetical protein